MSAVVKVLVTKQSTPSFLAVALPRLLACAMQATWVTDAFITVAALPTNTAFALSGLFTIAVVFVTSRETDRFSAVLSLPAGVADFLSLFATGEVSKSIIPRAAVIGAPFSVVIFVAHKAIGVLEFCSAAAVQILRPFLANGQVSLGGKAADEAIGIFCT